MEERRQKKEEQVQADRDLQQELLSKNLNLKKRDEQKWNEYMEELKRNKDFVKQQASAKKEKIHYEMNDQEIKMNKE